MQISFPSNGVYDVIVDIQSFHLFLSCNGDQYSMLQANM